EVADLARRGVVEPESHPPIVGAEPGLSDSAEPKRTARSERRSELARQATPTGRFGGAEADGPERAPQRACSPGNPDWPSRRSRSGRPGASAAASLLARQACSPIVGTCPAASGTTPGPAPT